MTTCHMCGRPVPEPQTLCSMCYGDPHYGRDGYYIEEMMRQEDEQRQRERAEEEEYWRQMEESNGRHE